MARLLVAGAVNADGRHGRPVRLQADDSLDPTSRSEPDLPGFARAIVFQPDGRGVFVTRDRPVRVEADGRPDLPFLANLPASLGEVRSAAALPDGKLLVGTRGSGVPLPNPAGGPAPAEPPPLLRLNPDGSLDPGFRPALVAYRLGSVEALLVQPDGKILVAGSLSFENGPAGNATGVLARLNSNGALDLGFTPTVLRRTLASGKYLLLVLDPDDTVAERDETNNVEYPFRFILQPDGGQHLSIGPLP